MTAWRQWAERPQSLLLRRIIFQLHLWLGVGVAIYVAVVSISGSAIVFRREVDRMESRRRMVAIEAGAQPMSLEKMQQSVKRAYPTYELVTIREPLRPRQADIAVMERGNHRIVRLFDPYTGADLGSPRSGLERALGWLEDLHDNLLSGLNGRMLNGLGALLVVCLAGTGAVVWWPGVRNWKRSIAIRRKAGFARFNWDLHSAVGFWFLIFVLTWGISGINLCFPGTLNFLFGSKVRLWMERLHFGRFNTTTEALWTIIGLAPAVLALTGTLMWWNRVVSKKVRRLRTTSRGSSKTSASGTEAASAA
jgi:uncharacterized iron-regulated membrane protein